MNAITTHHAAVARDAARVVATMERELAALLPDTAAPNHANRCTLYFDMIALYRARAGLPPSMEG